VTNKIENNSVYASVTGNIGNEAIIEEMIEDSAHNTKRQSID
jgi:hypothetical protein